MARDYVQIYRRLLGIGQARPFAAGSEQWLQAAK
jgi:hypothetical protein